MATQQAVLPARGSWLWPALETVGRWGAKASVVTARLAPFLSAALLATLGLAAPPAVADESAYAVIEKDGAFELRQYPAMLLAETLVASADFEDAGGIAFNRLFQYISGNNRGNRKIAMNSP